MNARIAAAIVAVKEALHGHTPPEHVTHRAAALVGHEEVVWGWGEREKASSGWIALFTPTRVVHVRYDESEWSFILSTQTTGTSSVTARSWPRRDLTALEILTDDARNSDRHWNQMWQDVWPPGSRLRLRYSDGTDLLIDTPALSSDGEVVPAMSDFVAQLSQDLVD